MAGAVLLEELVSSNALYHPSELNVPQALVGNVTRGGSAAVCSTSTPAAGLQTTVKNRSFTTVVCFAKQLRFAWEWGAFMPPNLRILLQAFCIILGPGGFLLWSFLG